jgi:hypothetical protein
MQTPELGHSSFCVGSHWLPRFEFEPQTGYVPFDVVTLLQTLNIAASAHAVAPASGLHAMKQLW